MSRRIKKEKKHLWRRHRLLSQEPLTAEDWREVYEFIRCIQLPFLDGIADRAWRRIRKCPECGGGVLVDGLYDNVCFECEDCGHEWSEKHVSSPALKGGE